QMSGEIPAVYGGDILRVQRTKVPRVVPVVEVAAEAFEFLHRGKSRIQSFGGVERAQPAEIVRGNDRQKIESNVGWRCSMGQLGFRLFLEVVRRKHAILRGNESLEEAPGAAGY